MLSSDTSSAGGIWPGYVAAVACLLQALVLVCGVVALIIATVSVTRSPGSAEQSKSVNRDALAQYDFVNVKYIDDSLLLSGELDDKLEKSAEQALSAKGKRMIVWVNAGSEGSASVRQAYIRIMYVKALMTKRLGNDRNFEYRIFTEPDEKYPADILHISAY